MIRVIRRIHEWLSHVFNWWFLYDYFKLVKEWKEGVTQPPEGGYPFPIDEYTLVPCGHQFWREKRKGEKHKPLMMFCDACLMKDMTLEYGRKGAMKRYWWWNKLTRGRA